MNASQLDNKSVQLCKSANALIPRQFDASSSFCKNSAHAALTKSNCKMFALDNKTLKIKNNTFKTILY